MDLKQTQQDLQKKIDRLPRSLNIYLLQIKKHMTQEQKCWKIIEDAKWKLDHDYDRISSDWVELSKNEFKMLESFIEAKVKTLMNKYEAAWLGQDGGPGIDVSDDGWSDLVYDVIGRGERFYNSITTEKLRKMANDNDYKESFSYCLQID